MVVVNQGQAMPGPHEFAASGWARGKPDASGDAPEDAAVAGAYEASVDTDTPDETLMRRFCDGEEAAFEALFGRYKQPIFGFFRRRVIDPTRAEELTQECFLALLRSAERYRPQAAFRTFLYGIAFKLLQADRRKSMFRALWNVSPVDIEPADPRNDVEASVVLRDALRKLETHDREVLMLRTYEELSYAEIAELLKMPVNTVRSRLFRARAALRELLTSPRPAHQQQATIAATAQGKEQA